MPPPIVTPSNPPAGGDDGFEPLPTMEEFQAQQQGQQAQPTGAPMSGEEASATYHKALQAGQVHSTIHPDTAPQAASGAAQNPLADAADQLGDVAKGVVGGVEKGVINTSKFLNDYNPGVALADKVRQAEGKPTTNEALDQIPTAKADTPAGSIAQGVAQFAIGMIGGGKSVALLGGSKITRTVIQGGVAQATAFDPHEERLSNLIQDHTSLGSPITDYLAADPKDTEAEGRLKNFLEGATLTGAAESLFAAIKGIKAVRDAKATGGEEAGNKALAQVADELQAKQGEPQAEPQPTPVPDQAPTPAPDATVSPSAESVPNTVPPEQDVKDAIKEFLQKTPETDPGYSVDFNLAKQSTTAGAKQVINLMSEAMAGQIDSLKGGAQTFDHIKNVANLVGEDPQSLLARVSARAKDANTAAADMVATEQWMLSMARSISEEARRVDNGLREPDLLNQMMDQMSSVVSDLKAVKTGAARTTAAGRIIKGDIYSMQQVKALVASGGDAERVIPIIDPPSAAKRGLNAYIEYWVNSVLSGPKTHVVNCTTNLLQTFARPAERMLGGQVREGLSEFMGMAKSIQDSVAMAARSFKVEAPVLDPITKMDGPHGAIGSAAFGLNPDSFMGAATDWLGKVVRIPTRFLTAEDEFFKQLNYRSNLYSKATQEGVALGKDGADLASYIESRFQSAFDGTGQGLDEASLRQAQISTFTEPLDPNSAAGLISQAAQKHPGIRLIAPFIRVPSNILKQVGQRTPFVNRYMSSYQADVAAGGERAAQARGKWVTGGLLWSAGILLASQNKLTGKGPSNPDKRKTLEMAGWQPYSVKIGDSYYSYSRMDPFSTALGLCADFSEARGYIKDPDAESIALAMGAALASNLTSKTYLQGVTEVLDAMSQPDHKLEKWFQSRVGSNVPTGFQQIAGLVGGGDDTMREVRTAMDALYARTPGLSETLPPKRNILGEPIHFPSGVGSDSVSPFSETKDVSDPVKQELARLSYGFQMPATKIGHAGDIDLSQYKSKSGQDAYDRLMELREVDRKGRYTLKERLAATIESDSYKNLPDGNDQYASKKLDKLRQVFGEYQESTMKRLRQEYPQLDQDIRTDERNAKVVKRSGTDALKPLLGLGQ